MRMFGDPDEAECSESLVVLNQFDSGVKLHHWLASSLREAFYCMHEKTADSLTLAGRPDSKLANIDAAWFDFGESTTNEFSVFYGQEEILFSRLLCKRLSVELVQGGWWIDTVLLIRERCMQ